MVEVLGNHLDVNMADHWQPDEVFLDLLKDKEAINAMLSEIGGKTVAKGNLTATAKVQKSIIQDFLHGENGRDAKSHWQPRYMAFPIESYTKRKGIRAMSEWFAVKDFYDAA